MCTIVNLTTGPITVFRELHQVFWILDLPMWTHTTSHAHFLRTARHIALSALLKNRKGSRHWSCNPITCVILCARKRTLHHRVAWLSSVFRVPLHLSVPHLHSLLWVHLPGHARSDALRWPCRLSGRMADDARTTGYEPNLVKDSQTCTEVSSEYTPINIAARRENFSIEDDGRFTVCEELDIFTPRTVSSQRSAASTVAALVNLGSVSCRRKPSHGYESTVESFSSFAKLVPCDRSLICSRKTGARGWICFEWWKCVHNANWSRSQLSGKIQLSRSQRKTAMRERSSKKIDRCWSSLWKQRLGTMKIRIRFVWKSTATWIWKEETTPGKFMGWSSSKRKDQLCGELELRNRIHHENHARTNQEIEELWRIYFEEANQVRIQVEELSLRQNIKILWANC